jgi:hypothetical protein
MSYRSGVAGTALFCLAALGLAVPQRAAAQAAPIFVDGFFTDWTGPVEWTDPAGDGAAGGVDFRALDLANDGQSFFIRFDCTTDVGLQDTNNLVLYLDTDQNALTGTAVSGIGAELRWQFGAKTGTFYRPAGAWTVFQDDLRLRELPSVTSPMFELSLGRDVRPDGVNLLFPGGGVRVLLRHETTGGDQVPNVGQVLTYVFDTSFVPQPDPSPLARQNPNDLRITTWNVVDLEMNGGGWNAAATPGADRVLSALDPDILCFEEIYDNTAVQTAALIESFLPSGPGEAWYARNNSDVKIVSRFPVLGQWNLDGAAGDHNLVVLLDTSPVLGRQLLLAGAHMFCCTNNSGRQAECDRMMALFRDAKSAGGTLTVPQGTMLAITGDLNLVGLSRQLTTLRTGDISDEVTFGPDFTPDWDGTPFADLVSSQTERRFAYTWRNDTGGFAPGRLDFFLYSDNVVSVANHFILYTPEMSAGQLALYGLQAADVTTVSDHLPHTADFRSVATDAGGAGSEAAGPRRAWATLRAGASPRGAVVHLTLQRAARIGIEIFDVRGARVAVLREAAEPLAAGTHAIAWDARTANGRRAPSGVYLVRLVAEDAGGMVLATSTKLTLVR